MAKSLPRGIWCLCTRRNSEPIKKMKNPTLVKNMKHVKWSQIPPLRGPNPQDLRKEVKQDTKKPEKLNGRR